MTPKQTALPPEAPESAAVAGGSPNTSTSVITVTLNDIPGHRIVRILGPVYGLTVQSRNWGADIASFFKSSVGGELKFFTNLAYKSRNVAVERMIDECVAKGGNAVIAFRYDTSDMGPCVQTCAYGTACLVERVDDGGVEARGSLLAT